MKILATIDPKEKEEHEDSENDATLAKKDDTLYISKKEASKTIYQFFISRELNKQRKLNPGLTNEEYWERATCEWKNYRKENGITYGDSRMDQDEFNIYQTYYKN